MVGYDAKRVIVVDLDYVTMLEDVQLHSSQ